MAKKSISVTIDKKLNEEIFRLYTKLQSEAMNKDGKLTKISFSKVLNAILGYGIEELFSEGEEKIWEYIQSLTKIEEDTKKRKKISQKEPKKVKTKLKVPKEEIKDPIRSSKFKDEAIAKILKARVKERSIGLKSTIDTHREIERKLSSLESAKSEEEIKEAEENIRDVVHKKIKDSVESGADRGQLKEMAGTIKDKMADLDKETSSSQSKVVQQMSEALISISKKLEENSKKLESFAQSESKKIDMIAEKLTSSKEKRRKIEKKELDEYLGILKKKKTYEGEDHVTFD